MLGVPGAARGCQRLPPVRAAEGAVVGDTKHGVWACTRADAAKQGLWRRQPEVW